VTGCRASHNPPRRNKPGRFCSAYILLDGKQTLEARRPINASPLTAWLGGVGRSIQPLPYKDR
jgi:hypothetical protein